jgi:hypothetical protein
MDWITYNSASSLASFTSGAAGTCVKVGSINIGSISQVLYCAMMSISSPTIATAGVGIAVMQVDNKLPLGSSIAFPQTGIILACPAIPLSKGIVGNSMITFSKVKESFLVEQNNEVGIYFYSEAVVAAIHILATIQIKPSTLGC